MLTLHIDYTYVIELTPCNTEYSEGKLQVQFSLICYLSEKIVVREFIHAYRLIKFLFVFPFSFV